MKRLQQNFRTLANAFSAALLAALFLTFLYQVFARYLLESSPGWTVELCLALWVWIIFWGSAFTLTDKDHVTFDMIYDAVRPKTQRILSLVGAAIIAVALLASFLPTLEFLNFLKIKKSATMPVSMREVFSIYGLFLLAAGLSYAWRFFKLLCMPKAAENDNSQHSDIRS